MKRSIRSALSLLLLGAPLLGCRDSTPPPTVTATCEGKYNTRPVHGKRWSNGSAHLVLLYEPGTGTDMLQFWYEDGNGKFDDDDYMVQFSTDVPGALRPLFHARTGEQVQGELQKVIDTSTASFDYVWLAEPGTIQEHENAIERGCAAMDISALCQRVFEDNPTPLVKTLAIHSKEKRLRTGGSDTTGFYERMHNACWN